MAKKLIKSVVNSKYSLIGFIVRGKEKELGGMSNDEVERPLAINELIATKFSNNQISVVGNKIVEKSNFRINKLPMVIYNESGYFDINNNISLIGRFVQNNENIGFRVKFADGTEDNLKYASLLQICKWFNPENFSIRTSSKGNSYICAKQGYGSIDSLPTTVIGEASKAKRTKSAAKEKKEALNGSVDNGFDIIDIYDFIASCSGNIIKLPTEKYEAVNKPINNGEFTSLGIGEVASATPIFSSTKLNVNAGFKQVGTVKLNMDGADINIPTFTFRTKSVFLNGENYMKRFGVTVPKEKEAELVKVLGASLALEKIEDLSVVTPICQILGTNNIAIYKVDTSKIDLISPNNRSKGIKSNSELIDICKQIYNLKLISKSLSTKTGLMKEIKGALGKDFAAAATGKSIFSSFRMYTKESLKAMQEAGIDIYSGSYNAPYDSSKSGKSSGGDDTSVEIEYKLNGYDVSKITGVKVLEAVRNGDKTLVPEEVYNTIDKILNIPDLNERYSAANNVYKSAEAKLNALNRTMWLHNASMFIDGNKSKVHTHDAKNWIPDTTSKVKKALVYICTEKDCTDLSIKLTNTSI